MDGERAAEDKMLVFGILGWMMGDSDEISLLFSDLSSDGQNGSWHWAQLEFSNRFGLAKEPYNLSLILKQYFRVELRISSSYLATKTIWYVHSDIVITSWVIWTRLKDLLLMKIYPLYSEWAVIFWPWVDIYILSHQWFWVRAYLVGQNQYRKSGQRISRTV